MRILAVVCVAFALWTCALAQCDVPKYLQGNTLADSKTEIITNISIDLQDFTPNKLVCLAKKLKEQYRDRESVIVSIFSSQAAATYLKMPALPPEPDAQDYAMIKYLHGSYVYRKDIHDDYVVLIPDAMIYNPGAPTNTKIDLSTPTVPPCNLQINDRCLLEFDHISLLSDEKPATVRLIAKIESNGSVSDVRLADGTKNHSKAQRKLADFATQNLKSWRFESGQNEDNIRIVYSIEGVKTPLQHGVNVQFMLPDAVRIQTSRWWTQ